MRNRLALPLIALLLGLAAAPAPASAQACLSPGETREAVAAGRVVPAVSAVRAAEGAVPGAQVTQVDLCPGGGGLVYRIAALGGDGRFVTVIVDAGSGGVVSVN
ncbi:PepSY domain-containing protein [Salinarimonas chemoclinalis]|uniref:PepSY domain-containing protein n=1 Tax=Salinarimonas chemoclinalis TaxID=3241599 RepID=UPI00355625C2